MDELHVLAEAAPGSTATADQEALRVRMREQLRTRLCVHAKACAQLLAHPDPPGFLVRGGRAARRGLREHVELVHWLRSGHGLPVRVHEVLDAADRRLER